MRGRWRLRAIGCGCRLGSERGFCIELFGTAEGYLSERKFQAPGVTPTPWQPRKSACELRPEKRQLGCRTPYWRVPEASATFGCARALLIGRRDSRGRREGRCGCC